VALGIHIAATEMPLMQSLLGVEPLPLVTWGVVALLAAPVMIVMEGWKRWTARAADGPLSPASPAAGT